MACIVCATRGGEGSRAVQREAVRLAKEQRCRLIFLYILDTNELGPISSSLSPNVRSELYWIGQTLVNIARNRALLDGVEAEIVIREGKVEKEIASFLAESKARLLVLGAPRGTTEAVFGDDAVEQFAQTIEASTGVVVKIVRPESITD